MLGSRWVGSNLTPQMSPLMRIRCSGMVEMFQREWLGELHAVCPFSKYPGCKREIFSVSLKNAGCTTLHDSSAACASVSFSSPSLGPAWLSQRFSVSATVCVCGTTILRPRMQQTIRCVMPRHVLFVAVSRHKIKEVKEGT